MEPKNQLIAIVGPTASGKSSLAISIAEKYGGEIVCADSRTVYRGMDIGTAKPTLLDIKRVPHHCLDLINPNERYSVAQFQEEANLAIEDSRSRSKLPILTGGSGLYIDAVLYNFKFGTDKTMDLEQLSLEELRVMASEKDLTPSKDTLNNKRHLTGYIQRGGKSSKSELAGGVTIVGIKIETELLHAKIEERIDRMIGEGLVDEIKSLLEKWGPDAPGLQAPGYGPMVQYVLGNITLEEAKTMFIRNDKQLAKRQMTWFKRNKDIQWVANTKEAEQLIKGKFRIFDTM